MRPSLLSQSGFTLMEVVVSVLILGVTVIGIIQVFSDSLIQDTNTREYQQIHYLLQDKIETTKSYGFWIWRGDTNDTNLSSHPIESWKTHLATQGFTGRAIMDVTFLKESGGEYVAFDGTDFDGNEARDKALVTFSLETSQGAEVSQNVMLFLTPHTRHAWAQLKTIQTALLLYAEDNGGAYPDTSTWTTDLVPDYLAEIPNDPFTEERYKVTHIEESSDWYYSNDSGTVTLAAQSHVDDITLTF